MNGLEDGSIAVPEAHKINELFRESHAGSVARSLVRRLTKSMNGSMAGPEAHKINEWFGGWFDCWSGGSQNQWSV